MCDKETYFYDSTPGEFDLMDASIAESIVYTCSAGGEWSPVARVPDCIGLCIIDVKIIC